MTCSGGISLATVVLALCLNFLCYSYAQDIVEEPSAAERLAWVANFSIRLNDRLLLWRTGWSLLFFTDFYDLSEYKGCKKGELTYHSWPSQMKLPPQFEGEPPCSFFIACHDGKPKFSLCPSIGFQELREDIQGCIMANHSTCANSAMIGIGDRQRKLECPEPNGKFSAGWVYCQAYIECINNDSFIRRCPGLLAFNNKTGQCDAESEALCAHSMWRRKDMPGGGMAKANARSYYVPLISESPMLEDCGRVTVPRPTDDFSVKVSRALPAFRDCKKWFRCSDMKYHYCAYLHEFSVHLGECLGTGRTYCVFQDVDYVCPEPNGDFANPLDCNAYYHCEDSRPQLRGCVLGESFSLEEAACRPASPDCPPPQTHFDISYSAGGSTLGSPLKFDIGEPSETPRQSRPAALGWRSRPLGLSPLHPRL